MHRTKQPQKLPDAINRSVTREFTQVPNTLLRDPEISAKAKTVLALLLSNREGWKSYFIKILEMMKEGETAVKNALDELKNNGYLVKIRYRDKQTRQIRGSFWAYTDTPYQFESLQDHIDLLDQYGLEALKSDLKKVDHIHRYENHPNGIHPNGNQELKTPKEKDQKKNIVDDGFEYTGTIISSQFEDFWAMYPKKDGKGAAKKAWEKLCRKRQKDRPTWETIERAIQEQMKSERWQDRQFIPHASTWLNQERWLDDPAEMVSYGKNKTHQRNENPEKVLDYHLNGKADPKLFRERCFEPAKDLVGVNGNGETAELAENIGSLFNWIKDKQRKEEVNSDYTDAPMTVIIHYMNWIEDSSWIKDKDPGMFRESSKLFSKFLKEEARHNFDRDPITGKMM